MQYRNLSFLGVVASFALATLVAAAESAKKAEAEVESEAEAGPKKEENTPAKKEAIEYYKKEAQINTLRGRIDEANKQFLELVNQKNRTVDKLEKQKIAEKMLVVVKDRNKWAGEFNALRLEVKYKYPGKGEVIERRYLPIKERTAEEMEQASDLDEQLIHLKKQVDKKYAPFKPRNDALEVTPETQAAQVEEEKPKKIKLVK